MAVRVKICGLTRAEDAAFAATAGASYLGVVLAGGPRQVNPTGAADVSLQDAVEIRQLEAPEGDALRMELEGFVRAVRGEASSGVSGAEGRAALALALTVTDAVRRFHGTG